MWLSTQNQLQYFYTKYFYSALLRYHFMIPWKYIHPTGWNSDGSVLGHIFSNFYMSALENKVFSTINKPNIYWRYPDDILLPNSTDEINKIHETFQNNSVLNFTQEININSKIPFLVVLIDTSNIDRFITSTYKKKLLTLIPAPSISKVNASSAIKEQL